MPLELFNEKVFSHPEIRGNYKIWKAKRFTPEEFAYLEPDSRLLYLVLCGHTAPSTHNTQPWAFKINPELNAINIYLDRSRVLPVSDVKGRQAVTSVGCAVANIINTSRYFGIEPAISFNDIQAENVTSMVSGNPDNRFVPLAQVKFNSNEKSNFSGVGTLKAIFDRRVDRGMYDGKKNITDDILKRMQKIGEKNGVIFHLLDRTKLVDQIKIQTIADLQNRADSFVINDLKFRTELAGWFLPNDTVSGIGMPGNTFGQSEGDSLNIYNALNGNAELRADDMVGFASSGSNGIKSAALVGLLSVHEDKPKDWLKAGISLEEVVLLLQTDNIHSAFHAGLAEADNVMSVKLIKRTLKGIFGSGDNPVILFRAGYSDGERDHAPRLPLEEVLLT